MITGELKNKVDGIWDIFWAGGLTNPLDVIEQITYLMFIHDLDESDIRRAKESAMLGLPYESIFTNEVMVGERTIEGSQLKWSVFHDFPADRMYSVMQEWVFPFIKELHGDKDSAYSKYMGDAIFKVPTPLMLSKVVDKLDEIFEEMAAVQNADVRGDVYEYLLNKISQSGVNGQFRTPRHIIKMMVEMVQPKPQDTICDPACGTSGFLIAAGEYLNQTVTNCNGLKMLSKDGKRRMTDVATTEQVFRLIQSIPSKKAEPFKLWLAQVGRERIEETIDPEQAIDRALGTYLKKGYSEEWVHQRLLSIRIRNELTEEWQKRGVKKGTEFAILTDEISKAWSGMSTREYKNLKGLKG